MGFGEASGGGWAVPEHRRRGRAALSNVASRFDAYAVERVDDGWGTGAEEELPPLRTEVALENPRKIISRNSSPDLSFDRSVNAYRGCEHGCIYCFARPTHAYLGLSPGLDFETQLVAKPNAPERLAAELASPRYEVAPIAMGTNTDPYQPIERTHRITRRLLEVLRAHNHPVGIVTKGSLIERDLDILGDMGWEGLARVGVSITTLDPELSRKMEPRVPSPARRLKMIERLAGAGVQVRVMASPMIPGLTDHEMEKILAAARDAGAVAASYIVLRLPREVSPLFRDWLEEAAPERASRVMARVREMHGGRDYDPEWGRRMKGQGTHAALLSHRFEVACKRLGLKRNLPPLRCDLFRVPPKPGDQLDLFS
ncbi:PA0069 family radical SAM protein [Vannielia litorea]|uniref:PA0069 family radical SAM protein n=1 Tax=Vannielia litorea TaxID=1217970 RepID=UPI001C95E734|nr:PA0069 family radical SAM protein [Vannielia litorea]MBY6047051.1 PA0069 family radical SAM protein [Vannielia litorea]MBY6074465.1 PA0069 family radical SAM protein [Vannielia litorea]